MFFGVVAIYHSIYTYFFFTLVLSTLYAKTSLLQFLLLPRLVSLHSYKFVGLFYIQIKFSCSYNLYLQCVQMSINGDDSDCFFEIEMKFDRYYLEFMPENVFDSSLLNCCS